MRSSEAISLLPIVGFSDAPTTAIDWGLNSASSCIGMSLSLLVSAGTKEGAQQLSGAPFLDAAINFRSVMGRRQLEETGAVLDGAAFRIVGAEIEAAQPREGNRRSTHRARFERDVKVASVEVFGAEPGGARAQRQHLGMRGGIAVGLDPVAGGGQDTAPGIDQHGANRHLAECGRRFGLSQR